MGSTQQGTFLVTNAAGVCLYASPDIQTRTGFDVAQVVGRKPGQLWGGQMPRSFYDELWTTIRRDRKPFVGEVNNHSKNGQENPETLHLASAQGQSEGNLYFDIQPKQSADKTDFQKNFVATFSDESMGLGDFLSFLQRWTTIDLPDPSSLFMRPAQYVRTHLIEPMQSLFTDRQQDAALIAEAKENPEAFGLLFEKYRETIRHYFAKRLQGHPKQVEDLTQETFLRAFRYLGVYRTTNASYKTYLLRIAHNLLVNTYRKRRPTSLEGDIAMEQAREIDVHALRQELDRLTIEHQAIMYMKYEEGLSVREISQLLGRSENAIKLLLSRIRKGLRGSLTVSS